MRIYLRFPDKENILSVFTSDLALHKMYDKILAMSKLESFADKNFNVAQMVQFPFDGVKNIVGNKKMVVNSIFSFSHSVFKRFLSQGHLVNGLLGWSTYTLRMEAENEWEIIAKE